MRKKEEVKEENRGRRKEPERGREEGFREEEGGRSQR